MLSFESWTVNVLKCDETETELTAGGCEVAA